MVPGTTEELGGNLEDERTPLSIDKDTQFEEDPRNRSIYGNTLGVIQDVSVIMWIYQC